MNDKLRKMGKPVRVFEWEFRQAVDRVNEAREVYGMSDIGISRAVGGRINYSLFIKWRTGVCKTMTREKYNLVMGMRMERPKPRGHAIKKKVATGAGVDPAGTVRRLQALQADGFTTAYIGDQLGIGPKSVSALCRGESGYCLASTRDDVAVMYDKLEGVDAASELGVHTAKAIRNRSLKKGWAPRICWDPDTIDDPEAFPEWTGACGTVAGWRIHKMHRIPMCQPCLDAEDTTAEPGQFSPAKFAAARIRAGLSKSALAKQLGVNESTIAYWENGKRVPRQGEKLSRALDLIQVSLEDVLE